MKVSYQIVEPKRTIDVSDEQWERIKDVYKGSKYDFCKSEIQYEIGFFGEIEILNIEENK